MATTTRKARKAHVFKHSAGGLGREGMSLWAYVGRQYIGRLDMSDSGIAIYSGRKGQKELLNLQWEPFFLMCACMGHSQWEAKWRRRNGEPI